MFGQSDYFFIFASKILNNEIMEATRSYKRRTREEVMDWVQRARERKEKWEQKMQAKFAEEERLRKEAEEKHDYDLEWV